MNYFMSVLMICMKMIYSIENRSPFLDTNLFEWSQSIPTEHFINGEYAKTILRDEILKMPNQDIDKHEKIGFNVEILDYLDLNEKSIFR